MIALRSDHEIDHLRAVEDLASLGLRHATGHRDHGVEAACFPRELHRAHAAELGIDLLGRLLADVAGIENDEVGRIHVGGRLIAMRPERFCHALGVVGVHLTAESLDVQLFGRCRHCLLVRHEGIPLVKTRGNEVPRAQTYAKGSRVGKGCARPHEYSRILATSPLPTGARQLIG